MRMLDNPSPINVTILVVLVCALFWAIVWWSRLPVINVAPTYLTQAGQTVYSKIVSCVVGGVTYDGETAVCQKASEGIARVHYIRPRKEYR